MFFVLSPGAHTDDGDQQARTDETVNERVQQHDGVDQGLEEDRRDIDRTPAGQPGGHTACGGPSPEQRRQSRPEQCRGRAANVVNHQRLQKTRLDHQRSSEDTRSGQGRHRVAQATYGDVREPDPKRLLDEVPHHAGTDDQ